MGMFRFKSEIVKILCRNVSRFQQPHVFENKSNKAHLFKTNFIYKVFLTKHSHIYRVNDKRREHSPYRQI